MNLPNKITIARIITSIIVILILLIPWYALGIEWPNYLVGNIKIDLKYIVAGILFVLASFSDFLDGYLARKNNEVTDFGKTADAIADKILVNGVLIILAYERIISVVIPVVIVTRDIIVDSLKMVSGNHGKVVAASIWGKIKTVFMLVGLVLVFFYNLPFELLSIPVADLFLLLATIFSVISGCQYFYNVKDILLPAKATKKK